MALPIAIGLGWYTSYPRKHFFWPWPEDLPAAYRPGSLLVSGLEPIGVDIRYLTCDERFQNDLAQQFQTPLDRQVALLHIACHGSFDADGYQAYLPSGPWRPAEESLPCDVLILETCSAIDSAQDWRPYWQNCAAAPNLRLVLGYDRTITMDRNSSRRGWAFAQDLLAGRPIAEAWLTACRTTQSIATDRAVAIGFGDDDADADWSLNEFKIDAPFIRRHGAQSVVRLRV